MKDNKVYLDWRCIDSLHRKIALDIKCDKFIPSLIVSIPRGGMVTSSQLSYLLDVKDVICLNISRHASSGPNDHTLCEPALNGTTIDVAKFANSSVLIVDGAIGTGKTVDIAVSLVRRHKARDVRVAVTAVWAGCPSPPPDAFWASTKFYIGEAYAPWPEFPWEV